jgi:hypothetical protein
VVERLKSVAPTPGQKPAILVYLGVLLQKGKLNALESAELARCALLCSWLVSASKCTNIWGDQLWRQSGCDGRYKQWGSNHAAMLCCDGLRQWQGCMVSC